MASCMIFCVKVIQVHKHSWSNHWDTPQCETPTANQAEPPASCSFFHLSILLSILWLLRLRALLLLVVHCGSSQIGRTWAMWTRPYSLAWLRKASTPQSQEGTLCISQGWEAQMVKRPQISAFHGAGNEEVFPACFALPLGLCPSYFPGAGYRNWVWIQNTKRGECNCICYQQDHKTWYIFFTTHFKYSRRKTNKHDLKYSFKST